MAEAEKSGGETSVKARLTPEGVLALFDDMPDQIAHYEPGRRIFREGGAGDVMYVVRKGVVELTIGGQLLDMVEPGSIFGEMSLIDGEERSATARATTPCELIPVTEAGFIELVRREPGFSLYVMTAIARRVRRLNLILVR